MSGSSIRGDLIRGAIAGGVATWVMDMVTTGMQQSQSAEDADREVAARPGGRSSVANLVQLGADSVQVELDEVQRSAAEQAVHYGLGVVPGAIYAVLRNRLPLVGAGRGALFGTLNYLVNDEYLGTKLGVSGPPDAYPASTHLRGLVGHVALGVATDAGIDVLGGSRR